MINIKSLINKIYRLDESRTILVDNRQLHERLQSEFPKRNIMYKPIFDLLHNAKHADPKDLSNTTVIVVGNNLQHLVLKYDSVITY
jgi:hypothetical protein